MPKYIAEDQVKQRRACLAMAACLATFWVGGAKAQSSTNCISLGGSMVHCDTMDMSPPPSTAGTTQPNDDGQAVLGNAIGSLIARSRESAFRKKVGQMLANGDCQGAARYAYDKGRPELGNSISRACSPKPTAGLGTEAPGLRPQAWVKYAESTTGSVFYYDKNNISRQPGNINVLVMADQALDRSSQYPKTETLYMVKCDSQTSAIMMLRLYDINGNLVRNYLAPSLRFDPAGAGSVQRTLLDTICKG